MKKSILAFRDFIDNIPNDETNQSVKIFKNYSFYFVFEDIDFDENPNIKQNFIKSEIFIVNRFKNQTSETNYFIIGFEKTIIIIEHLTNSIFEQLFSINSKITIMFLANTQNFIDDSIKIKFTEQKTNKIFENQIEQFNGNFQIKPPSEESPIYFIFHNVISCITGYLIQKSYYSKLNKKADENFDSKFKEKDYVELGLIGVGSSFDVYLIYHYEYEELFVVKKPKLSNEENLKLIKRITENCQDLIHPSISKFYGVVEDTDYIVMEFINGKSLDKIDLISLSNEKKYYLTFKLLKSIEFLNSKKFIYRDLKPDNIIIDNNEQPILIDFDRLIKLDDQFSTFDFSDWTSPEIKEGNLSMKSDIYSLGKLMKKIFFNNDKSPELLDEESLEYDFYTNIQSVINKCVDVDINKRPSITELIQQFTYIVGLYGYSQIDNYFLYQSINYNYPPALHFYGYYLEGIEDFKGAFHYYSLAAKLNYPMAQYNLALLYIQGRYVSKDNEKAIYYLKLAANQNFMLAQAVLGDIYYNGKYVTRDIKKAIYYYELVADQNVSNSQFNLGLLYFQGKFVERNIQKSLKYFTILSNQGDSGAQYYLGLIYIDEDYGVFDINKAIHYLTLSANNNYKDSCYLLGVVYSEGKYVQRDINKSIYYYILAANQNDMESQYNLGVIYSENKLIPVDINKAINYFTLASEKNCPNAQYNLGCIYYKGEYVIRDFQKAINYFTLAADNNHAEAQFNLGVYYEGIDINKSIYYYTLSSNNNYTFAQFNLGVVYIKGFNIKKDIDKAIHYFTLAADLGHVGAQKNLALYYKEGEFVKQDINKSIYYSKLAANLNDSDAQYFLGNIYLRNEDGIKQDINKFMYYFTLSAKQNNSKSQYVLGMIYYEGRFVVRDIDKSIYYLTLSSDQNNDDAQYSLGMIYNNGEYVPVDIKKSFYYLQLSANQNNSRAFYSLGLIYYEEKHVPLDLNKAIYYFSIAASLKNNDAQFLLGYIYYTENMIFDIKKSIHYFTLAANNGNGDAQYYLGVIYYDGFYVEKNIIKAIDFMNLSEKNKNKKAAFFLGFLYHEGKNVNQDIHKSIHYYKSISSFNNKYAKNNLGIIYKNGFNDIIKQNIGLAKEYFNEAIRQKNDYLSMHNLANILIFEENDLDKSIELLIKASAFNFHPSKQLLSFALVKKVGVDLDKIEHEIKKIDEKNNDLYQQICYIIFNDLQLDNSLKFEKYSQLLRYNDFLYKYNFNPISIKDFCRNEKNQNQDEIKNTKNNINKWFYCGFENDS